MKSICPNADCTWGHVSLGAVSGLLPSPAAAAVSLGFGAYELMRSKPESSKVESLVEFGVGFLVGSLIRGKC
jgi:hypothetical protein